MIVRRESRRRRSFAFGDAASDVFLANVKRAVDAGGPINPDDMFAALSALPDPHAVPTKTVTVGDQRGTRQIEVPSLIPDSLLMGTMASFDRFIRPTLPSQIRGMTFRLGPPTGIAKTLQAAGKAAKQATPVIIAALALTPVGAVAVGALAAAYKSTAGASQKFSTATLPPVQVAMPDAAQGALPSRAGPAPVAGAAAGAVGGLLVAGPIGAAVGAGVGYLITRRRGG